MLLLLLVVKHPMHHVEVKVREKYSKFIQFLKFRSKFELGGGGLISKTPLDILGGGGWCGCDRGVPGRAASWWLCLCVLHVAARLVVPSLW